MRSGLAGEDEDGADEAQRVGKQAARCGAARGACCAERARTGAPSPSEEDFDRRVINFSSVAGHSPRRESGPAGAMRPLCDCALALRRRARRCCGWEQGAADRRHTLWSGTSACRLPLWFVTSAQALNGHGRVRENITVAERRANVTASAPGKGGRTCRKGCRTRQSRMVPPERGGS